MLHETKVGIVVACSFLGLVGAVLTLKMKEGKPATGPEAEVPPWSTPASVAPQSPTASAAATPAPTPAAIPAAQPINPPVNPPAATAPNPLPETLLLTSGGNTSIVPPAIAPPGNPPAEPTSPLLASREFVGPPPPPPGWEATTAAEPGPAVRPGPVFTEPGAGTLHPGSPALVAETTTHGPGTNPLIMPPPGAIAPPPSGLTPGAAPSAVEMPPDSPRGEDSAKTGLQAMSPSAAAPVGGAASSRTTPAGSPPVVAIGPPEVTQSPPGVMPIQRVPSMQSADTMPESSVHPAGQPLSPTALAAAPTGSLPPLGAPPAGSTPPIVAPPVSGLPKVESYDEEICRCKAGDSFAGLAQQYYHNPKYEKALLMFNRDHPLAADHLKTDPPALQPNQAVYIPPAKILENRYASLIPDLTPLPAPSTASPGAPSLARVANPAVPQPAAPIPALPQPGAYAPGSPAPGAPAQPAPRTYQVQNPGGEMMWRIAQQQLGNGDRWVEIRDLNPNRQPEQPVPAGTVVRLPAQ